MSNSQQAHPSAFMNFAIGAFFASVMVLCAMSWAFRGERSAVHAQSSVWETIAHPEPVGGVTLSIVRHAATGQCFVIAQSGGALSVAADMGIGGLCDTPEELEKRKLRWGSLSYGSTDGVPENFRWGPEAATVTPSSQPSAPQTTKQPGVPK